MNIKHLINHFNYWLKNKSSEEITHSLKYSKYELERLLAEQSEAEQILSKENALICKCRYNYVIHQIHS